jgi:hypothetical protein
MFKKIFIGLAPLLAIAAFAVMPAAAQAVTQHWYVSGTKATEGEQIPVVWFGNEINLGQTSGFGEVNCRTIGGGTIENPVGGGAGVGSMNALTFYECKGEQCEKAIFEKTGVLGVEFVEAKNIPASINGHPERNTVPWRMLLEESTVAGVTSVRLKIGETFIGFKKPSPPGMIRVADSCDIPPEIEGGSPTEFEGELQPEIGVAKTGNLNGTSATAPSQAKFNGASTNELHSSSVSSATYLGNLKYLGYFHQELITVKP